MVIKIKKKEKKMLLTLLSLLAIPVGYYLYIELTAYYKVFRYKRQGIKHTQYYTMPGFFLKMTSNLKLDDTFIENKKKAQEQDPNQPFRVMNFGTSIFVSLISEKAVKEFYTQETKVTIKRTPFGKMKIFGFLFENGKEAQEKRAIFAKIFHYSNVLNLMPNIRKVIQLHVNQLKKRAEAEGGQIKIDLKKEFSRAVMDDLSACILLGGTENKMTENFEGMNVTQLIQKMVMSLNKSQTNPLNWIPFMTALGLNREKNEAERLKNGLTEIVRNEYNKRYNKEELDDKSVLDITVKLNKESEKETGNPKFSVEEIASNFELFQFAASDTSFHLSSTTMTFLALPENQKYQKGIQAQVDSELGSNDSYSNEKLNSLKELDNVFREAARLANPASAISRFVTKDFKLDGFTVYKGDNIINELVNFEPGVFNDPLKFNPDRFNPDSPSFKKAPKLKEIPFSHGQRACLGKYLGEMVVKLILVELLREFEVSVEPGYAMKLGPQPLYTVLNPNLCMKIREKQE